MKNTIILSSVFFLLSISLSAQNKKAEKLEKKEATFKEVKQLVESGNFTFNAYWLTAQEGWRQDVNPLTSTIIFSNGIVKADLPYFGVVRFGLSYAANNGIIFNGKPLKYKLSINDKKLKIKISFKVKKNTETFTINATVNSSGAASFMVNSVNRNSINYRGYIVPSKDATK